MVIGNPILSTERIFQACLTKAKAINIGFTLKFELLGVEYAREI